MSNEKDYWFFLLDRILIENFSCVGKLRDIEAGMRVESRRFIV